MSRPAAPRPDALRRWSSAARRATAREADEVRILAERLDDKGCAYGRVIGARLDEVARAYERLEIKLNAVLAAVIATLASVMVGLLVQMLRAGGL